MAEKITEKITSVKQLKQRYSPPANVNVVHRRQLSKMDKIALVVTDRIGTMGFFIIILGWTFLWLSWNILAPKTLRFDPYPAFVLWLFISNLIQIHLMPLIMIGQNIHAKHAELRAEHDFEIDKKGEKEIESILLHLESQQDLIEKQEKLILQVIEKIERLEKKKT